jgi:bacillithiol biosynthesis deacetylase BshB1
MSKSTSQVELLAIAAHRDDAELTCGGTLRKAANAGYRVGILDLTQGEMGSRGSAQLREQEAHAAAKFLGISARENLALPDAGIQNTDETRALLVAALRRFRPRVVIAPSTRSRHPDHRLAAELVRDACFLSGLTKYAAGDDAKHRPFKLLHVLTYREDTVKPTFVVDVSDTFAAKMDAVRCYDSQFSGEIQAGEVYPNGEPLYDIITHQAAHYGSLIRCKYGEPFWTDETMRVDDVMSLGVSTF